MLATPYLICLFGLLLHLRKPIIQTTAHRLRPGVTAEQVHAAYAEVIQGAGYEYPFRCGRATGFSFLEKPQLVAGDKTVLRPGMVFAVDGSVSVAKTFRALEMYDVEKLYVEKESMAVRGISEDDLNVPVEVKTSSEIGRLMAEQDVIFTF